MTTNDDAGPSHAPAKASSSDLTTFLEQVQRSARAVSIATLPIYLVPAIAFFWILPLASSLTGILVALAVAVLVIVAAGFVRGMIVDYVVNRSMRRDWKMDFDNRLASYGYADGADAPVGSGMAVRHKVRSWLAESLIVRNKGNNRWVVSVQSSPLLPVIIMFAPIGLLILLGLMR